MSLPKPQFQDRKKVLDIQNLPVLPKITKELLDLKEDENAGTQQLAEILNSDPVLAAHFLKHASAAFFGAVKNNFSLQDAINRIGYSTVLNMSIGISASSSFNIPENGPIGMQAFWRHAVYSAHLMQMLAYKIANKGPKNQSLNPDMCFLSGLLHNIGYVLLGDQFREEFNLINNNADGSKKTLLELEELFLGIPHTELGVILMRSWGLPAEIIITIFEHHNSNYKGPNWQYANLAYVSNYLLSELTLSDMKNAAIPDQALDALGLNESIVESVYEKLMENSEQLDSLVESLFHS